MPIPTPSQGEPQDTFISRCMGNDVMNKEFPDQKQRAGVCYSSWRKHKKEKESLFCNVKGFETKELKDGEFVKCGYIATTHLDNGFYNDDGKFVRDRIAKETLDTWANEINQGIPRVNKVSVNHNREPHVAGVGVKGSAKVDKFPDGEYGLYVETLIDKTNEKFDDIKYRLDNNLLDSFSIEFMTKDPATDKYIDGAVYEESNGDIITRMLLPETQLHGWTLASQPMNEHAIMIKEIFKKNEEIKEEIKMVEEVVEKEEVKKEEIKEVKEEIIIPVEEEIEKVPGEEKEKGIKELKSSIMKELKEELNKVKIEEKIQKVKEDNMETKEVMEYKQIFDGKSKIDIATQFKIAGRLAESKGMLKGDFVTGKAERREFKNFSTNGRYLEFKGLGVTTNQNADTDYLLSAAELNDVFDPVIYNALNQAVNTWNLLPKDDYSSKGNNQVQFTLKTASNTSATAYTGNAVSTGNVTRLKYQTKFKKYQVGVEVDGDMIAAARGGPIGDVFVQEVRDSTDDLLSIINIDLFGTSGTETVAPIIGFRYIADSASYTTLYNLTRSSTNKLSPDAAADNYINGASANVSITNLRAAVRQAVNEGARMDNIVFITHPTQVDKIKGIYDSQQRPIPVSARFGFEGTMTFDGIPIFADKDCVNSDVFLIDLETHRVGIWVPPTLEMLGKDADSQKGFIKTYFAVYNRAPRRLCWIYSNKTT